MLLPGFPFPARFSEAEANEEKKNPPCFLLTPLPLLLFPQPFSSAVGSDHDGGGDGGCPAERLLLVLVEEA